MAASHRGFEVGRNKAASALDTGISGQHREFCVQLLKNIAAGFQFHFKVFEQSVMIFDKSSSMLPSDSPKRERTQLTICCMILAMKFEGIYMKEDWLSGEKGAEIIGEGASPSELSRLQLRILCHLNWSLRQPSPSEMAAELLAAVHRLRPGVVYRPDSEFLGHFELFICACLHSSAVARVCSPFNIAVASVSVGLEVACDLELSRACVWQAATDEAFDLVALRNASSKQKRRVDSCSNSPSSSCKPRTTSSSSSSSG